METIKSIWFENGRIYMLSSIDKVYSRPLEAFPRLKDATQREREAYKISLKGEALRWDGIDEDIHISSFHDNTEPDYANYVAQIFTKFPQLDVEGMANAIGIDKDLMQKYISGMKKPSEERMSQLKAALHTLSLELSAI